MIEARRRVFCVNGGGTELKQSLLDGERKTGRALAAHNLSDRKTTDDDQPTSINSRQRSGIERIFEQQRAAPHTGLVGRSQAQLADSTCGLAHHCLTMREIL